MNKNYKCDLTVEEFAHYTGRSLSTFKKDFAEVFHNTPSRWIVKRRLEEAKCLMEKLGEKACGCVFGSRVQEPVAFLYRIQKGVRHFTVRDL